MVFFVFSELRWEVIVHFVDIRIVDHHCLNFLFIIEICIKKCNPVFQLYSWEHYIDVPLNTNICVHSMVIVPHHRQNILVVPSINIIFRLCHCEKVTLWWDTIPTLLGFEMHWNNSPRIDIFTEVKLMTVTVNYGHPKMSDMKLAKNLFCRLNCFYNVF